jgi:hypothetical protein
MRRAERWPRGRVAYRFGVDHPLTWPVALLLGSVLGLGLRLVLFVAATVVVRAVAVALAALLPLAPTPDPVYSHAALNSLGDIQIQGLAIGGPPGRELHTLFPALIVLGGLAYTWATNGPEDLDRVFGLVDPRPCPPTARWQRCPPATSVTTSALPAQPHPADRPLIPRKPG